MKVGDMMRLGWATLTLMQREFIAIYSKLFRKCKVGKKWEESERP